jgi:hypothetical protein
MRQAAPGSFFLPPVEVGAGGDFRQNRALGVCVLRRSVLDENVQARSRNCHPLGQEGKVHTTGRQLA